jgi:quinohemoprotein ethanol dehydrogenase
VLFIVGILAASLLVAGLQNRRVDENALKNAGKTGEEWLTYGLNYAETRYSPLKQIDATNVQRLGLAWTYEIGPGGGNQEGTPLMANGVIYGITNWSITTPSTRIPATNSGVTIRKSTDPPFNPKYAAAS